MPRRNLGDLVRYLQRLPVPESAGGSSDAELLERYVRCRDQAAFELLLWRHSVLVFNVCRRILPREHDAEDAFQATFLALVRKAHAIVRHGSIASWLYKVAYRVALEARERARRTRTHEQPIGDFLTDPSCADPVWNDVRPILDEEVNRLPQRLRRAFVLCYLEGKTNEEAARQLGCPPGTIFSRLARGRELLRQRLVRRGVTLTAALLTTALGQRAAEAVPATPLVAAALRGALLFADGQAAGAVSAQVTILAEGVLRTMFLTKLKTAALVVILLGLFAMGGVVTQHALKAAPQAEAQTEVQAAEPQAAPGAEPKKPAVQVVRPTPGGLERIAYIPGHVRAAAQQQVAPAVSGYLKRQPVGLGDRVKKGDILAEIDAPLLLLEVKQAVAAVVVAEGQVAEAKARVATATAELQAAKDLIAQREKEVQSARAALDLTQKQSERVQGLSRQGVVSQQMIEEKQERLLAAQALHQKAQVAVASARADIAVQESKIDSARAALESAKAHVTIARLAEEKAAIQLGFTTIRATSDGVVTQTNFEVGDFIAARDAGPSRPLMTVQRTDVVRVVASVPQVDALLTRPGVPVDLMAAVIVQAQPRNLAIPEEGGIEIAGQKVTRIGYALDEVSGTMPVEIDVPNPENLLRPGMAMNVALHLAPGIPEAFTIPEKAMRFGVAPEVIYVVRDGKAHLTPVRFGQRRDGKIEILAGLKATDQIVINPDVLPAGAAPIPVDVKKKP